MFLHLIRILNFNLLRRVNALIIFVQYNNPTTVDIFIGTEPSEQLVLPNLVQTLNGFVVPSFLGVAVGRESIDRRPITVFNLLWLDEDVAVRVNWKWPVFVRLFVEVAQAHR